MIKQIAFAHFTYESSFLFIINLKSNKCNHLTKPFHWNRTKSVTIFWNTTYFHMRRQAQAPERCSSKCSNKDKFPESTVVIHHGTSRQVLINFI